MKVNDSDWQTLFVRLQSTRVQLSLVVTGGGSGVIGRCFRRVGASRNFVEATIPYSRGALTAFLGSTPIEGSVSEPTAIEMASVARRRAESLADLAAPFAVGLAITAALPTEPPSDFASRACVAIDCGVMQRHWTQALKETIDRQDAEQRVDALAYQALHRVVEIAASAKR